MTTGPFCTDNPICGAGVWWCTIPGYLLSTVAGVLIWASVFYAAAFVLYPAYSDRLSRFHSKYKNEESRYWFANHVASTIHAILISVLVVPTWVELIVAPPQAAFAQPAFEYESWFPQNMIAANAAHIFLCYIICDFIVGFVHDLHQSGNALHHVIFVLFTVLIMYNCFLAFVALTLLLMETSTIFLNYYTFWRNRTSDHGTVKFAMVMFGVLFFVCRIVCLLCIMVYFAKLLAGDELKFDGTPEWHIVFIFSGLAAALMLQLFWFWGILKKMKSVVSREPNSGSASYEEM
eukprot:TRINITY_DN57049_c0_g1_i1.p1 TRINITY_DN57049_c0_g1~~TRINITY_DN57049_c0_g1_i1.p1  ORF type:complete len:291 (+),score=42.24 TRINITY_DN57049_c0_g1_i1:76-948(+)